MVWKLKGKLGQGGLGIVHLYQNEVGENCAVKRMICQWDEEHYKRFKREISILGRLVHKNIIKVVKHNIHDSNPWYMMPYYQDGSLRDRLMDVKREGKVYSTKSASAIIFYLASALKHSHAKGIIHRDLKPENILFDGREPILADWGIGKFIHRESTVYNYAIGTPSYCAPEQWNQGVSDKRSDIYSLGLIFRELLTGSIHGRIKNSKVRAIVTKMTKREPKKRFQSMYEVMKAIKNLDLISEKDPLKDFAEGVLVISSTIAVALLLAKLLSK